MSRAFGVVLNVQGDQFARLHKLQVAFAALCNDLAPFVSKQQCWNRVTLHHLKYRELRIKHPDIGSQMVCNAIYAVSKVSRLVYQHPASPFHVKKMVGRGLPIIKFSPDCPVYFDSHTLTLNGQSLSMYTMDGRIKFELTLTLDQKELLATQRLTEITLSKCAEEQFMLTFYFSAVDVQEVASALSVSTRPLTAPGKSSLTLPPYVGVETIA